MHLTRFTDYALRTLMYLGARPHEVVPVSEISQAYDISSNHVAKAAKWLTRDGYVRAHRGISGGLQLGVAPARIGIGALIRRTEQLDLLECFDPETNACRLAPACRLRPALRRARDAFQAVLDEYTLADLLDEEVAELVQLMAPTARRRA